MDARHVWTVLIGGITAYELAARDDELLTCAVRRARARHPILRGLVDGAICFTAAHLLDVLPPAVDPFTLLRRARALCRSPRRWTPLWNHTRR